MTAQWVISQQNKDSMVIIAFIKWFLSTNKHSPFAALAGMYQTESRLDAEVFSHCVSQFLLACYMVIFMNAPGMGNPWGICLKKLLEVWGAQRSKQIQVFLVSWLEELSTIRNFIIRPGTWEIPQRENRNQEQSKHMMICAGDHPMIDSCQLFFSIA